MHAMSDRIVIVSFLLSHDRRQPVHVQYGVRAYVSVDLARPLLCACMPE